MRTPLPGKRVRGSQTGRPILALLDLLGRRWILRVIWELRAESLGFRSLQQKCGRMSASVLSQRLRDLARAGVAETDECGDYRLTPAGRELLSALMPLHGWAEGWARAVAKNPPPADYSSPKRRSARR